MQRPLLFLDLDDVLCIVTGPEAFQTPTALWHPPAVRVLRTVLETHRPRVVLTTGWLRLLTRDGFEALFRRSGLTELADALDNQRWDAPAVGSDTRLKAIETWLYAYHQGEPLVVLDDEMSGTGLRDSWLDRDNRVVWCELGVGLYDGHLPAVANALERPCGSPAA
jgi:hypothetical protein